MTQGDSARAAALLREHRRAAGLSQRRLAELAGVSIGVVRDLEQRRTSHLHAESVRRLADALVLDQGRALEFARAARTYHKNPAAERSGTGAGRGFRLAVLGPVTAWRGGERVGLGPARQRAVLRLLALTPNVAVHRKTIIDALWGDDVPASAVHLVQVYVNKLRQLLDPGCLLTSAGTSYELVAVRGQIDLIGARQLSLDVLSDTDAADLLTARLGRHRAAAEPGAVAALIALCAGLPVALVIAAARALAQPHLPLRGLAAELRAARTRLDALTTGDSATDVRSVFSWSYRSLSPPAARIFRLTGLHPGPSCQPKPPQASPASRFPQPAAPCGN